MQRVCLNGRPLMFASAFEALLKSTANPLFVGSLTTVMFTVKIIILLPADMEYFKRLKKEKKREKKAHTCSARKSK